jgi:hypothetical protein
MFVSEKRVFSNARRTLWLLTDAFTGLTYVSRCSTEREAKTMVSKLNSVALVRKRTIPTERPPFPSKGNIGS